jgi:hypothetical protein
MCVQMNLEVLQLSYVVEVCAVLLSSTDWSVCLAKKVKFSPIPKVEVDVDWACLT